MIENQVSSSVNSSPTNYPGGHTLGNTTSLPVPKAIHYLTLSRGFLAFLWTPYTALSTAVKATQESDSVAILRVSCSPGEYVSALGNRET